MPRAKTLCVFKFFDALHCGLKGAALLLERVPLGGSAVVESLIQVENPQGIDDVAKGQQNDKDFFHFGIVSRSFVIVSGSFVRW